MFFFFLFPLVFLAVLAIWLVSAWKARSLMAASSLKATVVLALALCYVLALAMISADPWYDDNGSPEFIAWPERFGWAAEIAGWLALLVVPAALGLRAFVLWRKSRRAAENSRIRSEISAQGEP
ncbi:hypothetical protein [Achromobacter deleyi]|uniref:hypothetical protein n=1 Tax=Achromobacter deleyi TaxID=1353891 RepID=UPI001490C563|nr:hypothetical protein [Achromobacter deleyi]QVQ27166.1 hypothetical protein HLG70_01535 [Achromobacter deleyi]UIP22754.1 hypothetical protein LYZ39_09640 [Achromobacter deleyi]